MQFIDTHIHLQDFKDDFALSVLGNHDAQKMILVAAKESDYSKIAALVNKYPDRFVGAFGVHPWYSREIMAPQRMLEQYLQKFPNALVGEIGVDGLREPPHQAQYDIFLEQLEVAKKYARPVIIHGAKATEQLYRYKEQLKSVKFSYHGFVKDDNLLRFIIECGGYIGLGSLFLKQKKAREMWQKMPKNKILFETDAPYRVDEENYNIIVKENLLKLAEIAEMDIDSLSDLLVHNAEEFIKC